MVDRIRTKELLAKSLLELVKIKTLEKITVLDITRNCSLTREAFYYHFADRYDLMLWIYKNHTAEIIEKGILEYPIVDVWAKALSIMSTEISFYKEAYQDPIYLDLILNSFHENLRFCVISNAGEQELSSPDIQFAIRFYAHGLLRTTIEWLNQVNREDPYAISTRMCAIMPRILSKYYIF